MNYDESLHFILDTPNPGAVWERNVMENLLAKLGDPQEKVPHYVHVAGTNGKGSASAFMASVLRKAGYRTGEAEREALVRRVLGSDDLKYCPHGRPICIRLTKGRIERQFGRA